MFHPMGKEKNNFLLVPIKKGFIRNRDAEFDRNKVYDLHKLFVKSWRENASPRALSAASVAQEREAHVLNQPSFKATVFATIRPCTGK